MKYLILMQVDPEVIEHLSEEQGQHIGAAHEAFMATTKASGEFVLTQALAAPSQTKVIRGSLDQVQVTDGPFAETKEFLGGFYLLDVEDEARAIELAKNLPEVNIPGLALEIRAAMFTDLGDL
jgi:hypothetical protein